MCIQSFPAKGDMGHWDVNMRHIMYNVDSSLVLGHNFKKNSSRQQ